MERKIIALVLIALLAGVGGGYSIGYAISQQQFQNEINSMKTQLDMILSALGVSNGLANVNVTNFPRWSNVSVLNFPDWPLLTNVYVTNFPALTNANVTNLPLDADGNLKVSVIDLKPLQKYQESARITVVDCGSSGATGSGIDFDSVNKFLFTFNKKGTALNITDLWISYVFTAPSSGNLFITINGIEVASWIPFGGGPGALVYQNSVHIQDSNLYSSIVSGINSIQLEDRSGQMLLQELDIFIEYEYLA